MSQLGSVTCSISSNPDISGIGVRAAVYIQNFLSFVPAIAALRDGKVTFTELESLEAQSTAILITALAILISTVIQAHRDNGISNYHASIVLNLSWMNNTNLFIYLFLYAFRRAHLTPQQRKDEDGSLNDVEWVARRPHHWWINRAIKALQVFCFSVKKRAQNKIHEHEEVTVDQGNMNETLKIDQEAGNLDMVQIQSGGQIRQAFYQLLWAETKQASMDPVIIIGSLHLTFMAAIGIWFWSNPSTFGSPDSCSLSEVTTFVLGVDVLLGSKTLRIWSLLVYSILLTPLLNLIIPVFFFATLLVFKSKGQRHFIEHSQAIMGLGVLGLIEATFLIDTEVTLAKNRHLVESGENDWTFGQTLAILVLLVPSRDLLQSIFDQGARKQRRRLLLSAVNGAKGMVQVLLDLGVNKHDLNALLRNRSEHGDWEMMKLLFDNGANPDEPNKEGETAYVLATKQEHQNAIHVFVGQNIYVDRTEINKHIYLAARLNYPVSMKFLLENHARRDEKNEKGFLVLALHLAVAECKTEAVQLLLKHNVDVHVKDEYGQTALFLAAKRGYNNIVKLLLEHKADIHAQGKVLNAINFYKTKLL
ncbi:hypothetical protein C0992_004807 [Termitomyces sp. T32_za158]|nr:hypothetical protein C0992_004807 [Termitomyces sp. T32_za158]